jgi:hypothetical protein
VLRSIPSPNYILETCGHPNKHAPPFHIDETTAWTGHDCGVDEAFSLPSLSRRRRDSYTTYAFFIELVIGRGVLGSNLYVGKTGDQNSQIKIVTNSVENRNKLGLASSW